MSKATESKVKWIDESGRVVHFGEVACDNTKEQIKNCSEADSVFKAALMADNHLGYGCPVGGVVAYHEEVAPAGVGFDIACGNKAVETNLLWDDVRKDISKIMDTVWEKIAFGVGRKNPTPIEHELFEDPLFKEDKNIKRLKDEAASQLGTVGSGNHYVDILVEPSTGFVWVANHFGSRGFGHKIASGFMNLSEGMGFFEKGRSESMMQVPSSISLRSPLGEDYWRAMELAGEYAYAGRDYVVQQVLDILGATQTKEVHNNHNFAWKEIHDENEVVVVRKGATPSFPGQEGFVGGNMCDICVIIEGVDSEDNREGLYSAMHGAGRVMSRNQAKGKWRRRRDPETGEKKLVQVKEGAVSDEMMRDAIKDAGIVLRGGGLDESPFCYKKLQDVLDFHNSAIIVKHVMKPVGVAMAGANEYDPYKD